MMTNLGSETFPRDLPTWGSVWDLASGEVKSTLKGHTHPVLSGAISADGKTIVSGSGNNSAQYGTSTVETVR